MDRRKFNKLIALGALTPASGFSGFSKMHENNEVYDEAIVIDGLIIGRNWDDDSLAALIKTGYTGFNVSLDPLTFNRSLLSLVAWKKHIETHPDKLLHATSAADFEMAKREGKTAVLFGFQNTQMIQGDLENLDILYQAGTRWMQLTYNERNLLGDGCTERTDAGLSDFGISVVERMNALGIVIDLSHCGKQTTNDGIQFSKTGAMINHSMCEALHRNHPRAKTDTQIRAMADKGGVLGIICLGYMIGPNLGKDTTIETYVDHIDHAVNVGGIDHVGLAADYPVEGLKANGATRENWYVPRLSRFKPSYKVQWPPWIPELDETDRYRHVCRLLKKRGYGTDDIEKILGRNFLRYYREVLKA